MPARDPVTSVGVEIVYVFSGALKLGRDVLFMMKMLGVKMSVGNSGHNSKECESHCRSVCKMVFSFLFLSSKLH